MHQKHITRSLPKSEQICFKYLQESFIAEIYYFLTFSGNFSHLFSYLKLDIVVQFWAKCLFWHGIYLEKLLNLRKTLSAPQETLLLRKPCVSHWFSEGDHVFLNDFLKDIMYSSLIFWKKCALLVLKKICFLRIFTFLLVLY